MVALGRRCDRLKSVGAVPQEAGALWSRGEELVRKHRIRMPGWKGVACHDRVHLQSSKRIPGREPGKAEEFDLPLQAGAEDRRALRPSWRASWDAADSINGNERMVRLIMLNLSKKEDFMFYPKPFMRLKELHKMGIPKEFLLEAYRTKGQTFAQKINPLKSNSPIIFDTDGFEKWRISRCKVENAGIPRN